MKKQILSAVIAAATFSSASVMAEDASTFTEALTSGKAYGNFREPFLIK